MSDGRNLPGFLDTQASFAGHIRHPDLNPRPVDVEERRMAIYLGLFYRNIESFISSAFPVCHSLLDDDTWAGLIRGFMHAHSCESPYFLEISQEFIVYLSERGLEGLPPYLLELCHYEWVELELSVSEETLEPLDLEDGDLVPEVLKRSPLAELLSYQFPVHEIGPGREPQSAMTFLIVYRDEADDVGFIESNPLTHRLIELLDTHRVADAIAALHLELAQSGSAIGLEDVQRQAEAILRRLLRSRVLVGG